MRRVKRWRYYCDFCKKVGGSAGHMKTHELHCTGNPDRICRMCKLANLEQKPIGSIKKIVQEHIAKENNLDMWTDCEKREALEKEILERLNKETGGCPEVCELCDEDKPTVEWYCPNCQKANTDKDNHCWWCHKKRVDPFADYPHFD